MPGVGGKTVRSRRVTEQWNRKRAARKSKRERGGRERMYSSGATNERQNEAEGEREKEKDEIAFFPALDFSSFISYE